MTVNQYFQHYTAQNEQDLINDLVVESIQASGLDVAYIPRTQTDIDYLYNEDPTAVYNSHKKIEMYPVFVEGFDGDELLLDTGLTLKKTATFVVAKTHFSEEFPSFVRPREGDLIFMPITNAFLEIKFVDLESPFFEKGKQYVYELKTETFEFGYEEMSTGDAEIDSIIGEIDSFDQSTQAEPTGDNDELDADTQDDISFDPANPFGVR
jgi:hypothetical protein